ncbi:restriction endonuclease [Cronbergia sp. UHCC 0137]|uniref:restriction endonuclease n=1 Tax=Cronbergia sp. UHCC 0137 TaxID=3110239 RepID=UPI002B210215|nr:restriction endonuclease [Cronbergia sp. UHCC 0137]MEA5618897.1 restriction endonuclease [Cronbergia sp. UHCC 0137]
MDYLEINALINGIIFSRENIKQDLGRRFAAYLGLTPGKSGSDGGIDGYGKLNNDIIYFQSKLSQKILDASFAAEFVGNLVIHEANIGIMLAGVGYTDGFRSRLKQAFESNLLKTELNVHLLSLEDVFGETQVFAKATNDLPPLRNLSNGEWTKHK